MGPDEELFIETINDIKGKLGIGKPYELIRTSGLLRHLLLDGQPLVHQVNRRYRLKLRFEMLSSHEPPIKPTFRFQNLDPAQFPNDKRVQQSLDQFLAAEWLTLGGYSFSTKDIIQATAHLHGGVHLGNATTNKDKLINYLYQCFWVSRKPGSLSILRSIAGIVVKGLEPLCQSVRNAEVVRNYVTIHPRGGVRDIVAGMSHDGVVVSEAFVRKLCPWPRWSFKGSQFWASSTFPHPCGAMTIEALVTLKKEGNCPTVVSLPTSSCWSKPFVVYRLGCHGNSCRPEFHLLFDGDDEPTNLIGEKALPLGGILHIGATYDRKLITLFVDGEPTVTVQREGRIAKSSQSTVIGARSSTDKGGGFVGGIHELRIFNVARTAEQMREYCDKPLSFKPNTCLCLLSAWDRPDAETSGSIRV